MSLPLKSGSLVVTGGTKTFGGAVEERKDEKAPSPDPARRTRLLHMPVTVSLIGN